MQSDLNTTRVNDKKDRHGFHADTMSTQEPKKGWEW